MPRSSSSWIAVASRSISSAVELRRERVRRELRGVEDLVRPRAADAGDQPLVAQQRVQSPRVRGEDRARATRRRARRPRGRGARAPPRARPGRSSQTPARRFAPASVSTSSPPSSKRSRNIGVFGPFSPGVEVAQPAGAHQVHHQHELAVVGREEEPLRPPPRALEAFALERRERRVERLQRRDVRRARPCAIGERLTSGSSWRRQASISGNSGTGYAGRRGIVMAALIGPSVRRGAGGSIESTPRL